MNENENSTERNDITLDDLRNSYLETAGASGEEDASAAGEGASGGMPQGGTADVEEPTGDVPSAGEETGMPQNESGGNGYDERFGAAMGLSQQNDRMNALMAENAALKEQLATANAAASANAENANAAVAQTLTGDDLPKFDDEEYSFASDAERREIMGNYTRALVDYAVKKAQSDVLNRVAPLIDEYDHAVENAEFDNALKSLGASPEFADIASYSDDIRRLSEREEFKGMKPYQRVALTALIAKGMRTNPAVQENADIGSQADAVLNNEALMKEIELRKARRLNDSRGDYPAQSASGGLSSAAYQVPRKAQSIEELRSLHGS